MRCLGSGGRRGWGSDEKLWVRQDRLSCENGRLALATPVQGALRGPVEVMGRAKRAVERVGAVPAGLRVGTRYAINVVLSGWLA